MAILTERLNITTALHGSYNYSINEDYTEVFNKRQIVDSSNDFITIVSTSSTISADSLSGAKAVVVKNHGVVASEIQFIITDYKDNSNVDDANSVDLGPGSATTDRYMTMILAAGEFVYLPSLKMVSYAEDASAGTAKPTTNGTYLTLDANEYVVSGALTTEGFADDNDTTISFDDGSGGAANNLFSIGDLIRLDDEVCMVTSIVDTDGDGAYTPANFIVERGTHGTTKADHTNNTAIRLPFFNNLHDYDKYSVVQTNSTGHFSSTNFFGYGRTIDLTSDGIVPGSIAGKFYRPGHQSFGLTGITAGTNSGLVASTTYAFTIAVDGGSAFVTSFTTDSSNVNFGGTNGVLSKIQAVFDAAYYASGNLFEKRVTVSIIDGDIRFTSGQFLSTSAILLGDHSGTDPWGVGRIPALASINSAVPSKVANDDMIDRQGIKKPNSGAFFYDDGHGNIRGTADGSINYTTGAISFVGPPNSEFVITANYDSAHSGGSNTTSTSANVVRSISARSCNSKINCPIEIIAFN